MRKRGKNPLAAPSSHDTDAARTEFYHHLEGLLSRLEEEPPDKVGKVKNDVPAYVEAELPNLQQIFKLIDSKKDGKLDESEITKLLTKLGANPMKDEVAEMIWEVDDDDDGLVSWDEFRSMYARCHADKTGHEPRKLFNVVEFMMHDSDHDGHISFDEAIRILYRRFGKQLLDTIEADIVKTDTGKDITYEEFVHFLHKREHYRQVEKLRLYGHPSSKIVYPRPAGDCRWSKASKSQNQKGCSSRS